ncbi:MAG: SDR family oxidoreductase [Actinomycetota bacterium]|nr:SDR family oxidoreductase [Actinomycetota bacterium]
MADFTGRPGAALVVGGSGGLGRSVARMLAERGSDVALTWRTSPAPAELVVDEAVAVGVRAGAWQLDVSSPDGATAVVAEVVAHFGGLHTLVYAAGPHVTMTHLGLIDPATLEEQLRVDVGGFFRVVRPSLVHLREAAGSIVAVTTAATSRFPVRDGLSAVPKGAVEALVRGIAVEEGRFGVRANCVGPGMLTDGMAERLISSGELDDRALAAARANIPLRRFGVAADVAEAVCFLASDRARFVSGQKLNVDGGYSV